MSDASTRSAAHSPNIALVRGGAAYRSVARTSVVFGLGVPLPSGQIDLAGTLGWSQEGTSISMVASTAVPIEIDTDCASPFPVAGEVRFQVTEGATPGYVRGRFTS